MLKSAFYLRPNLPELRHCRRRTVQSRLANLSYTHASSWTLCGSWLARRSDAEACNFKLFEAFSCFALVVDALVLYMFAKSELGPALDNPVDAHQSTREVDHFKSAAAASGR